MKKNDERILKYLSELMNEKEKSNFEKELTSSEELKSNYESIINHLEVANISKYVTINEMYFTNVLPRVRERLEKKKKSYSWKSVYYLTPTAAAVVILSLFLFNSKTEFEMQYKELANEVVNNFSDHEVSDKYFTELDSNPADLIFFTEPGEFNIQIPEGLEISSDSYQGLIENPVSEDYRTFRELSENELEIVFDKLNLKTSPKVTK